MASPAGARLGDHRGDQRGRAPGPGRGGPAQGFGHHGQLHQPGPLATELLVHVDAQGGLGAEVVPEGWEGIRVGVERGAGHLGEQRASTHRCREVLSSSCSSRMPIGTGQTPSRRG